MLLETAKLLHTVAKKRPVPVKCDVTMVLGGGYGGGHFSRGLFIGVDGNKLKVKPHKHGGKIELYEPQYVNLWTSRAVQNNILTRQQVDQIMHGENVYTMGAPLIVDSTKEEVVETVKVNIDVPPIPSSEEAISLLSRLETATVRPIFVIADLGLLEEDKIQFLQNGRKRDFSTNLANASLFEGEDSKNRADNKLNKLREYSDWDGVISSKDNLSVIPFEDAQRLYDDIVSKRSGKSIAEHIVESAPVMSQPEPIHIPLTIINHDKTVEVVEAVPEVVPEVPVQKIPETVVPVFGGHAITEALQKMQGSMMNVQTAVDILREERKNLLEAQDLLIQAITKQVRTIDSNIAMGVSVLEGKR
jgi:hypothetical protein